MHSYTEIDTCTSTYMKGDIIHTCRCLESVWCGSEGPLCQKTFVVHPLPHLHTYALVCTHVCKGMQRVTAGFFMRGAPPFYAELISER